MIQKNLLIVALNWPEPQATAAGQRMMQLISFFVERDYRVTFSCTKAEQPDALMTEKYRISTRYIVVNDPGFDVFVKALEPDIVIFDRFVAEEQFGWRVAQYAPSALRILDTEDLHSLRSARKEALESGIPYTHTSWLQTDMAKREIAAIFRCDLSLIISLYEMEILLTQVPVPARILLYLPLWAKEIMKRDMHKWPNFQKRADFICIGNGKHAPNTDAFLWLYQSIWPLIRKSLPTARVHIYGAYLPDRIQQLSHSETGFLVHGRIADSHEVMKKSRVNLAPLRFGAGIKGKLVEAMVCGTPSITTTIGIEGLSDASSSCALVSDLPEEFAALAVLLYQQEEVWNTVQDKGVVLINSGYGKKEHSTRLMAALKVIQEDVQSHRAGNFLGTMLQYHTLASTKYLSRWITAKNLLALRSATPENGN